MKTKFNYYLLFSFLIATSVFQTNAQSKLIHFWDFNTTVAGDSLGNATNPLPPSYTTLSSSNPMIVYSRPYSPNMYLDSIMDNSSSGAFYYDYSSVNYPYFSTSDSAGGNNYIKVRNPSAGAYLTFIIPTTGYKNITFNYAMSVSSSKGPNTAFSYSTNGGTTWNLLTSAMDTFNTEGRMHPDTLQNVDSVTVGGVDFVPVSINFTSDANVSNCSGFILRMTSAAGLGETILNDTMHGGNLRLDNVAIMGDSTITGINELPAQDAGYHIYPNPVNDFVNVISDHFTGDKIITMYDAVGQTVSVMENSKTQTIINTTGISAGVYLIEIKEVSTGNKYTMKIVKE
jgi:Secretion system C-terminal sorting domain